MVLRFVLDNRERKLIELFKDDPDVVVDVLDVGDFQILKDDQLALIIERKTLQDLSQSIVDGRYREQKMRCMGTGARFVYILEGVTDGSIFFGRDALTGAVINTIVRDGIPFMFTTDVSGTAKLLADIKTRFPTYQTTATKNDRNEEITVTNSIVKKKNTLTKGAIFLCQLSTIPGISYKMAKTIVDALGAESISVMCDMLRESPACLDGIPGIAIKTRQKIIDALL